MPTSVRLPEDAEKRLNALAATTGRSKAFYIREAVMGYLDDLEDMYLAERRLEDLRAGRSRTYSLDEVEQELGLEH
jgi:RHH-type rel operon transcriptional repressor/antitoxin RelB